MSTPVKGLGDIVRDFPLKSAISAAITPDFH
jgi:hypothetical protein